MKILKDHEIVELSPEDARRFEEEMARAIPPEDAAPQPEQA